MANLPDGTQAVRALVATGVLDSHFCAKLSLASSAPMEGII